LTLVESAKIATFYNVDISGVDDAIRDVVTHHWLHHINQKHLQIREKDSLYNLFIRSKNIYFVTSIQPNHERQAENIIHHASTIYNMAKGRDPQHMKEQAIQRFEQWMIKISNNNSSENISQQQRGSINTTTITSSSSSSEYDRHRHASMFSSISNSTSLTVPESITEEKDHLILADLYRQIEELQNQVTVTRERNRHVEKELQEFRSLSSLDVRSIDDMDRLLMVEEKQSLLINGLESKLEQTEGLVQNLQQQLDLLDKEKYMLEENVEKQVKWIMEEVESLRFKKDEIQCLSSVMDQRLDHQEYMNKQNMEEIAQLRTRYQSQEKENVKKNHFIESVACQLLTSTTSTHDDMSVYAINENRFEELNKCIKELVVQRNRYSQQLKESRDEHEKLQHTFTMRCAKAGLIEKKSQHLTKELDSVRQLLRDQDTSGMIRKLENKITTLELEKEDIQADFEHSYESALNELKYVQKKADDHFHTIQSLERTTMGLHEQLTHSSSALIQKDQEMRILLESNQRLLKINDQLKYQNNDRVCRSRSSAPVKKPSFMETQIQWYKQKTEGSFGKIQVADRLLQMSEENHRLKVYIDELETKVMRVRQDSAREIQSLESEIYLLGEDGSRLLQHLPRPPLRHERKISIPPSPSSDFSRHASYLTSAPPTDPLPPVPTTPEPSERSCRNKIHMLEGDIRIHQQVISKLETQLLASETTVQEQRGQLMKETNLKTELALISDELHRERERTLKAERQCQILQKRIDHGMNKKNKFRCF
jgi:hypothetical protein